MKLALPGVDWCIAFQTHSLVSAVQAGVVTVKLTGVLPDISDPQLGQCIQAGVVTVKLTGVLPDISDPQLGQCSTGRCGDSETDWCIARHFRPTAWSVQYRPVW